MHGICVMEYNTFSCLKLTSRFFVIALCNAFFKMVNEISKYVILFLNKLLQWEFVKYFFGIHSHSLSIFPFIKLIRNTHFCLQLSLIFVQFIFMQFICANFFLVTWRYELLVRIYPRKLDFIRYF